MISTSVTSAGVASTTSTGGGGGSSGGGRAVIYAGGNSVLSLAAGGTQDTYIYSTQVGSGNTVNTGAVWMADAPGSIVGISMTNTGANQNGNNNVQFTKNGANLGPVQVLGPVTSQNTAGISIAPGTLPFNKSDAIRAICGNDTAGQMNVELWFTVAYS